MNSVPNNDLEQCPKSKTGLGAQGAHPTDPGCVHTAPRPAVSWRALALCRGRAPVVSWLCQRCVAACKCALARRVAAPLDHDSIYCIATHSPNS